MSLCWGDSPAGPKATSRSARPADGARRFEIAMPYYRDHIYPHLVDTLGDPPPIQKVRRQIIPLAQGTVLEIGVGSGANLPHYDLARVSKLYALEPNPGMIRLAQRRRHGTGLKVEFLDLPGESIPLAEGSVDGDRVPCPISEVIVTLLVGHRDPQWLGAV